MAYAVYQYVADILDANARTRETFNNYVREIGTYGQLNHERKSLGGKSGGGMYLKYEFKRDPAEITARLKQDNRLQELGEREEEVKEVVRAQWREFVQE